VRRQQELPPCPTEPTPASSKMGLWLAKAQPVSNTGSNSMIAYLRRGKKNCAIVERERSGKM